MQKYILIIDPFKKSPAEFALNTLSRLLLEAQKEYGRFDTHLKFFFPAFSSIPLSQFLESNHKINQQIIGTISLGSYHHVTEDISWLTDFSSDLKTNIIEQFIPFLGICFSHQLLAHIYDSKVDYIYDTFSDTKIKYDEFRVIDIVHPKLQEIQKGLKKFTSKARHEQEVRNFSNDFFELGCKSQSCGVEGLVHKAFPSFSIQSHPEEFHESKEGWDFLKNFFLYFLKNSDLT
jgi:GMP synthase-like glutamine amidotransferase